MMARATRSSTADLKRKRSTENVSGGENGDNTRHKQLKSEETETEIDCSSILSILETEDRQDLLSRVFPSDSLRSLLSTPTKVSVLRSAINYLRPISSSRSQLSHTAAQQQLRFCNLALSLLEQVSPPTDHLKKSEISTSSTTPVPLKPHYALVQQLPSGHWWTSSTDAMSDPASLHTGNAELVAILPSPSSQQIPLTTIASYSSRLAVQKKYTLPPRRVTTGAFLDYGPFASFAPSFDQDGELIGRRQLGDLLWYRQEKKRLSTPLPSATTSSVVEVSTDIPHHEPVDSSVIPDQELEALLGPEEVDSIKAALNSLELENLVHQLLQRNQRALVRLGELQKQRLIDHPSIPPEEGSEEWDTAQAILDSLTILASLRPRSSSDDHPPIVPSPSVLHKLHRTLAIEPSPAWSGTLPSGRTTALRDDSTVKIQPGTATSVPVPNTSAITTPTPVPSTNTFGTYAYPYATQQQQAYRPQAGAAASSYTPYKTQATSYYPNYTLQQQQSYYAQQSYGTNQQPYGATTGQQPYAAYGWYGQYASTLQASGRGTPQPQSGNLSYGSFFNNAASAAVAAAAAASGSTMSTTGTAIGVPSTPTAATRTPAVANTVLATPSVAGATPYAQTAGMVPTLPIQLRPSGTQSNGSTSNQPQMNYLQPQTQQTT